MSYKKPELSLWERTSLIIAIARTLSNGLYTSITGPFRGSNGSNKYTNHIKLSMIRTFLKNSTVRQQQTLTPFLDEAYESFAKQKGFRPSNVELSDGTKAFWVGNTSAEKVILWFHGGGYNIPPDLGHLIYANSIANSTGGKVAVLMLFYALAPHQVYPYQLRQAVELLRHVCTTLNRDPKNVIIAGDSAGANLATGVLSHLMHPHPEIPPLKLPNNGKLGSAILLAPWISFNTDWPSNTYNASKDLVSSHIGNVWSSSFLGGKPRDGYNEPLSADLGWWKGLDGVVEEILVVAGGDEVLLDSIREFARRLEGAHEKVTVVIAEGEWHDMPTNSALGMGGEQSEVIQRFVKARL